MVLDEVVRLDPSGAFVVGGQDSLSDDVIADLVDAGLAEDSVVRLDGENDAAVATAAAQALADTPRLSDDDLEDLEEEGESPPVIEEAVIIDPDDQVAPAGAALPSPTRLGGDDLATTSAAVAGEAANRGLPTNVVYLAGADQPMAGAVMASSVARLGGLMLVRDAGGAEGAAGALDGVDAAAGADRIVVFATTAPGRNWLPVALAAAFVVAGLLFAGLVLRRARSSS